MERWEVKLDAPTVHHDSSFGKSGGTRGVDIEQAVWREEKEKQNEPKCSSLLLIHWYLF